MCVYIYIHTHKYKFHLDTVALEHTKNYTYSGAKKYLVSHQLCKFSHLKRGEKPVGVLYTDNKFKQVPLIQVTSGGQRSLLKEEVTGL